MDAVPVQDHDDVVIDWCTLWHEDAAALQSLMFGPFRETAVVGGLAKIVRDSRGAELRMSLAGGHARLTMSGEAWARMRRDATDADVIEQMKEIKPRVARLDLARDVQGPWTAAWLACAGHERRIVSQFNDYPVGYEEYPDFSFYVGQPSGEQQLCTYGRTARLEAQGASDVPQGMTRWEIRQHGKKAAQTFDELASLPVVVNRVTGDAVWDAQPIHARILSRMLRVALKPPDRRNNNQTRARNDPLWDAFIAGRAPVIRSSASREGGTVEDDARRIVGEFVRSSTPILSAVLDISGPKALILLADLGRHRRRLDVENLVRLHPMAVQKAIDELRPKPHADSP